MTDELRVVGKVVKDKSAFDKVTGRAKFSNDLQLPNMLHAKLLKSRYARADIISVDISAAQAMPGVKLIMTKDNYPDLFRASVNFVGQDVACVVALDNVTAEKAIELIKVEYKVLPCVVDPYEASKPDAPIALPGMPSNMVPWGYYRYFTDKDENGHYTKRNTDITQFDGFGDMEEARKEADVFVKAEDYKYAKAQTPLMATSGCVADYHDGKLDLYHPTQSAGYPRFMVSMRLKMPISDINVVNFCTGGGFGGRLACGCGGPHNEASYSLVAAEASKALCQPVRLFYSREEEFLYYWGRSGMHTNAEIGFKKDGTLVTTDTEVWRNVSGAGETGMGTLLFDATATGQMLYAHNCKASKHVKKSVMTNTPVFVGWQGYGNPEVFFAVESAMDDAAEKLGIDPIELRRKNHMREGDNFLGLYYGFTSPQWLGHTGIDKCLDAGQEHFPWHKRKPASEKTGTLRHGMGMALGSQQNGGEGLSSNAIVKLESDGKAILICHYNDMGQGGRTAQCQIVAEILNIDIDNVRLVGNATDYTPYTHYQSCSSGTFICSNTTYKATIDAKNKLLESAGKAMGGVPAEMLDTKDGMIFPKGMPEKAMPWVGAFMLKGEFGFIDNFIGYADYKVPAGPLPSEQGATFAELDVDTETGQLKNIKITHCQDCGKAINPKVVEANYLSIHHGLETLTGAEQILDKKTGKLLNDSYIDYPVATILDYKVNPIIVEVPDPTHPYGAVGIGQSHQNGLAAAVGNAIYNAIGVRIKETPFTPARILKALGKI